MTADHPLFFPLYYIQHIQIQVRVAEAAMAGEMIISALVPMVLERAASLIEQQLGIVLGADVESELGKLQRTLATIQAVLEDAEERQVTDKALRLWLSNLKDAAYEAGDLLDDFNLDMLEQRQEAQKHHMIVAKVLGCFSLCWDCLLIRPRMCSNIRDIVDKFNSLAEQKSKFHLKELARSISRVQRSQTHSYAPESELVGRADEVRGIVELLLRQEQEKKVVVLPIVGMGGLGKTTLGQMVYNHPTVKAHFEMLMWLSVMTLDNFSSVRVAKAVIQTLTALEFGPSDMDSLQRKVRQVIDSKRFLLVLDDVWNEDPQRWAEVKVLLTFGAPGSAVIVTTRSKITSKIMGTLEPLLLKHLSEDDCWVLFSRVAFAGREEDPNLVPIGRVILSKCGRLPLAAKVLGGMMQLKEEEWQWRSVMESNIWDLQPLGQDGIQPVLLLSYYHLPSHLKQCFALCAIFPRGYDIEKETLIKLWMANGFILKATTTDEMEHKGHEIFQALEQRSFFQNVKEVKRWYDDKRITTFGMHDLIHNLVRSVSGNECYILDKWEEEGTSTISYSGSRHLFVNCEVGNHLAASSKGTAGGTATSTLRTLLFRGKQSDLTMRTFWLDAKYLRVLLLHNTGLSEFPNSICDLRHLRYLDLSHNDIKELPEDISRLFNLQTLDLSACRLLLRLPKSITRMNSLVHLYLEGCSGLRSMPAGMGQLRRLQALTRYVAGDEAGDGGIGELKDLNLCGALELYNLKNVENAADAEEANLCSKENLQQLDFDWGESAHDAESSTAGNDENVLQALEPHPKLKQLTIRRYRGIRYPTWLMGTGESVFTSLRRLELYGMSNLEEWWGVEGRPYFPHIAEMEITDCPVLRTMPALPSLQSLTIRNCPRLHPTKGFFGRMRLLKRLEMDSCDELVLMLEQEEHETGGPLMRLQIKNCNQLMFSSPSLGLWKQYFSSLQSLKIMTCGGLIILPVDVLRGLSSLKSLSIHCCFHLTGSSEGLSFEGLTSLEELEVEVCPEFPFFHPEGLKHLTALKRILIYSNHGLTELPEFPDCVRDVIIYNCWNLVSLPKGLGRLPSLETFVILSCYGVNSLPEEEMQGYKALKTLKLEGCPLVVSLPVGLQRRLPSLRYLEINGCQDLERQCTEGGEYWNAVSPIQVKHIGGDINNKMPGHVFYAPATTIG